MKEATNLIRAKDITTNSNGNIDETEKEFIHRDGGWGWVVVLVAAYNIGLAVGITGNYSLVYIEIVNMYNTTEDNVFYAGNMLC